MRNGLFRRLHGVRQSRPAVKAAVFLLVVCGAAWRGLGAETFRDVYPDTWVATDALGRHLPGYEQCGPPRQDRTVGIFYFLWLGQHGTSGPYDITRILKDNPDHPRYGPVHTYHHWGKPELGYYTSDSSYVIRKHARMLSNAGVDVLIFDVTNAVTYRPVYMKLCRQFTALRRSGQHTPAVMFFTHTDPDGTITRLYEEFYAKGVYRSLWFRWEGKPLILGKPRHLPARIRSFFTFRNCWAWTHGKDTWQWLDHWPQRYGWHESPDVPEQTSVCVAEHATTNIGRSFSHGKQPPVNSLAVARQTPLGLYFAQQWERALEIDPRFLFITGWNEWVACRFINKDGKPPNNMLIGRPVGPGGTYFVDAYSQEYSRDIEPMEGGHGDNYYYQMVAGVRRYKGVRKLPPASPPLTIEIDGRFEQWQNVGPEYRDHVGDVEHRDEPGWGDAGRYVDRTGRNDLVTMKVARDAQYVYFYARTARPLTSWRDPNWMLLFIDADQKHETGWNGYDFVVNLEVKDAQTTSLHFLPTGRWAPQARGWVRYAVGGSCLELAVARPALGFGGGRPVRLDFHWADNIQKRGDVVAFALHGDSAPQRRFNYRYRAD